MRGGGMSDRTRWRSAFPVPWMTGPFWLASASPAFAHAADRGFVMLLPTGYYIAGGAAAVAASFLVLVAVPPAPLERLARMRIELARLTFDGRVVTSLASFVVFCALLSAGFAGSRDPLSNPLPLMFWTVWWVGLTLAVGLFGNLWRWLEPWYGPYRLASLALRRSRDRAPFSLPARMRYWPPILLFLAFAWFELVYPAPDDPYRLAVVLAGYWVFTFVGMLLFGHRDWTTRVECFSIFFFMVARLSPFDRASGGTLCLRLPGAKATDAEPLPLSGALFLLLALSTVSYDGLMRTFAWLGLIGINPLEFPGRSAVVIENTAGLGAAFAALAGLFLASIWLGQRLAGEKGGVSSAAGALVWSIVPIALAYHFSHYLVSLVLNGQYALAAISDPLSRGWNVFGTAGYHVVAGAAAGADSARLVWNLQAAVIIGGHVLAVAIAHVTAFRLHRDRRHAALAGLPLAVLMVGYTVFGLWLLSSPTGY